MNSKILKAAVYYLLPVLLIFSLFLLWRGHEGPGGGFVGGLTASSGLALFAITHGRKSVRHILPVNTSMITVIGLLLMVAAGFIGIIANGNFLEAKKLDWEPLLFIHPGTTLLFDLGVYFVVIGSVIKIILTLESE